MDVVTDWAAHVAPLLDDDAWAGVRAGEDTESFLDVNGKHPVRSDLPEMFAALLAFRDDVATKVTARQRIAMDAGQVFDDRVLKALVGKFLMKDRVGFREEDWRTPFGREVARVLRGDQ